jgi:hypothetical protein
LVLRVAVTGRPRFTAAGKAFVFFFLRAGSDGRLGFFEAAFFATGFVLFWLPLRAVREDFAKGRTVRDLVLDKGRRVEREREVMVGQGALFGAGSKVATSAGPSRKRPVRIPVPLSWQLGNEKSATTGQC